MKKPASKKGIVTLNHRTIITLQNQDDLFTYFFLTMFTASKIGYKVPEADLRGAWAHGPPPKLLEGWAGTPPKEIYDMKEKHPGMKDTKKLELNK